MGAAPDPGWWPRVRTAPVHHRLDGRIPHWLAGAALLAGAWAAVARGRGEVARWELEATAAVNGLPDDLAPAVWPVMQLGNFWVWMPAAGATAITTRRREGPVAITAAVLGAWGGAKAVKRLAGRGRPADHLPTTRVRERGITGLGFVSGHAAIATAVAVAVAPWLAPRVRMLPFALAAGVGWSRIYVGAHLPLDVVGGAGLGLICGLGASAAAGVPTVPPAETLQW